MSNPKKITRRKFMGHTAKGVVGLAGYSLLKSNLSRASNDRSLVVTVYDEGADRIEIIGGRKEFNINQDVADRMTETGIGRITGIEDIGEAWKSLFPGITRDKVISIKCNCSATPGAGHLDLTVNQEVVNSITNGLTKMQVDGQFFPAENIIVWDLTDDSLTNAGFTLNKGDTGIKCYGSTKKWIWGGPQDSSGYSTAISYDVQGVKQYISKILVDQTDYLINLSVLKDMSFVGVTLSLKNHFGSCWFPYGMHNNCSNCIPALNAISPIRDKQVICIIDAIYGVIEGHNKPPQVFPNRLIFSTDTVAIDKVGRDLLKKEGLSSVDFNLAKYIETASQEPYNLGNCDPEKIEEILIDTPVVKEKWSNESLPEDFRIFQNYPNPFNAQTTLKYQLRRQALVKLNIYSINGTLLRTLVDEYQTAGHHRIVWDGLTGKGSSAASGTYLARFQIGDKQHTLKMQLVK